MPGYWWECECSPIQYDFKAIAGLGIVNFIQRDLSKDWNQNKLLRKCPSCGENKLRIGYEFPREEREGLSVVHIVGLASDDYIPMIWETAPKSNPSDRWFHFNYIKGGKGSVWGLNKAAVFNAADLHQLFHAYREKTGKLFNFDEHSELK